MELKQFVVLELIQLEGILWKLVGQVKRNIAALGGCSYETVLMVASIRWKLEELELGPSMIVVQVREWALELELSRYLALVQGQVLIMAADIR